MEANSVRHSKREATTSRTGMLHLIDWCALVCEKEPDCRLARETL
jgi:hypothetical protein